MQCVFGGGGGGAPPVRVCRRKRKPHVKRKTNRFYVLSEGIVPTGHACRALAFAAQAAGAPGAHPGCGWEQRPTLGVASRNLTSLVTQEGGRHLERLCVCGGGIVGFQGVVIRGAAFPWQNSGDLSFLRCVLSKSYITPKTWCCCCDP